MHQTRNDLQSNTKTVAIELLNARLADAIDLALLTKQAHWNLKGSSIYRDPRDVG
jgi:starvation-inducible DNA-binding protein